ncbi:ABC transporter permease [Kaistia dalseonensis]|uniref:Autoinducer 2 import system permease protein LsrC n=1 Tax=Kaistia dalseonensis TaxID=410840 RepID=A0ABU0HBR6_9HYPH|nr:ABC transporter permease [Kaistia dalseonensis]MCX5496602.1 ABC transporter permease [Kaistia dalseonensis]MDQ0439225.1 rhamnose transport system permease protein [Kaistia dalseonensis]
MSSIARLLRAREAGILVMLVLFALVVGLIQPRFLTAETLRIVLLAVPLIMVAAMGQMMVLVARHVDLSIGSILGFSAIAAGMIFRDHPDWPLFIGFGVALLSGALLGLFNGLVVTLFKLPSIIVTLGTLSLYRGLLFILSGSKQIDPNDIPEPLIKMAQTSPIDIPWIVIIAFGVALATHVFLTYSQIGRQIYAIGSNPAAAPLRGIRVMPVTILVFTLSGALAGLAGIIYAARFGYVNPGITGVGFEFTVIAAVVIGGVSINGGVGSVAGTVLGVLFLGAVQVALPILGVSGFWQNAIYGGIILIALVIDRTVRQGGLRGLLARGGA